MTDGGVDESVGWDFFVSYTRVDLAWAEWVAWTLEDAGFRVLVQAWDFVPGSNWVAGMDEGVSRAARTVAVLSEDYASSVYGAAEWRAAWAADPGGTGRKLLVFRVADCPRPGLLAHVASVDLFGVTERVAKAELLRSAWLAVSGGRGKPGVAPPFPPNLRAVPGRAVFPGGLPGVWNVPPKLARFVGRDRLVGELEAALDRSASGVVTALAGMGGVGKTALAVEYAHRNAGGFDLVWWIAAEDPDQVAGQLAELAAEFGLPADRPAAAVFGLLRAERRRWLLVVDNVEDPAVVTPLRPSGAGGRLLVTSRRTEFHGLGAGLVLPPLARAESLDLLRLRGVGDLDDPTGNRIAALLGDLPLAVDQASAYLRQTGMPAADYADLVASRPVEMAGRGQVSDRPGTTVANLLYLSLSRLADERPAALELLRLLSSCAPEPVPCRLFTDRPDLLDSQPGCAALAGAAADRLTWEDTVGALVGYSLARRDGDALVVHRVTQVAVRAFSTDAERRSRLAVLARLLHAALPVESPPTSRHTRQLLTHVLAVAGHVGQPTAPVPGGRELSVLFTTAAGVLRRRGQLRPAIRLAARTLAVDEADLGHDHPDTLASRHRAAVACMAAGRLTEALNLLEPNVARQRRVFGPDHPDTLRGWHELADTYKQMGAVGAALDVLTDIVATRARVLGPDHPDTLTSAHELADSYQHAGRHTEAVSGFASAAADRQRVLGPDHPDTLRSLDSLVDACHEAGTLADRVPALEQHLHDVEHAAGADEPAALVRRAHLARGYRAAGRTTDAIGLLERNAADSPRVFGPAHPRTLASRAALARAYDHLGRHAEAHALQERNAADSRRLLGPAAPDTLDCTLTLAVRHFDDGNPDTTERFRQLAGDSRRHLGHDHPLTITSLGFLRRAYSNEGRVIPCSWGLLATLPPDDDGRVPAPFDEPMVAEPGHRIPSSLPQEPDGPPDPKAATRPRATFPHLHLRRPTGFGA